jgi:hypothetical protein
MSSEERQATSWSTHVVDAAVQSYKTTTTLMSLLNGGSSN